MFAEVFVAHSSVWFLLPRDVHEHSKQGVLAPFPVWFLFITVDLCKSAVAFVQAVHTAAARRSLLALLTFYCVFSVPVLELDSYLDRQFDQVWPELLNGLSPFTICLD